MLVNGSTGISAGYATDIPPHHLGEVIDAVIMRMDKPDVTVDELMTVIKGPDFPTGGIIQGTDGIKKAYETGKGRLSSAAKQRWNRSEAVNSKSSLRKSHMKSIKRILLRKWMSSVLIGKLEGIADVRDETDRTGLRIVIELKKDADAMVFYNIY